MSYYIWLSGYITMNEEIYDDLIENEIQVMVFKIVSDDHGKRFSEEPLTLMLKDYFDDLDYVDGVMRICCELNHNGGGDIDIKEILESLASKLGEDDMGYIEIVAEDGDRWCYWLTKDKVECGEWGRPKDPDWFKG